MEELYLHTYYNFLINHSLVHHRRFSRSQGYDEEIFEDNFDEDTNTYEEYNGDVYSVYKVQEMTQKELDVLVKMGVLYR